MTAVANQQHFYTSGFRFFSFLVIKCDCGAHRQIFKHVFFKQVRKDIQTGDKDAAEKQDTKGHVDPGLGALNIVDENQYFAKVPCVMVCRSICL